MNFLIALFVPSKGGRHSHRVTDQGRVLQAVVLEERGDVVGHDGIVMPGRVGRLAVVAQILVPVSQIIEQTGHAAARRQLPPLLTIA